ncbi:AP-4 complex subunit mu-1 [Nymphon striatum]|nr:AP-4 complex subunit mu-1 [Nymphon striatum]
MMYVESLIELMPWFFALDRTNYSRWLSVHIRDMENLPIKHPEILKQFKAGKFTFQKTEHAFSSMPLDQAHEQNNLLVKGDGGAIGLTESPQALRRLMVGGPEIARLIQEFEQTMHTKPKNSHHHEQTSSHQSRFKTHVQAMVNTINDLGNPFCDESKELFSLCSKIVADPAVIKTINEIKETGLHQYQAFVKERLVQQSKPLHECIRQNKFAVFKDRPRKSVTSNSKLKLKSAKSDCQLFARLYIGCQNRGSNIDDFFSHENQAYPPSISDGGRLRQGTKADLIQCFDKLHETQLNEPKVSAVIVDGAAVVQILKPGTAKTFQDYSHNVFVPYIAKLLAQVSRVDVNVILIANNGKEVFATDGPDVLCAPDCEDLSSVSPCLHEEADTLATFHMLPVDELWIAFGTGNKFRYLPAHEYACTLGPEKSKSLPLFHALTGCDTVSSFLGCGKKTAWDVWMTFDESTTAFLELTTCPTDFSDDCMAIINGIRYLYVKKQNIYFVATSTLKVDYYDLQIIECLECLFNIIRQFCGLVSIDSIRMNVILIYEILGEIIERNPEMFVDVIENVTFLMSKEVGALRISTLLTGKVVKSNVTGEVLVRNYIPGQSLIKMGLNENILIDADSNVFHTGVHLNKCTFAESVDLTEFQADQIIALNMKKGELSVCKYQLEQKELKTIPLRLNSSINKIENSRDIEVTLKLSVEVPGNAELVNLKVHVPVPRFTTTTMHQFTHPNNKGEYLKSDRKVLWTIPSIPGKCQAGIKIRMVEAYKNDASYLEIGRVAVEFEASNFVPSGVKIRFLNVTPSQYLSSSSSNTPPRKWIRYVTITDSYEFIKMCCDDLRRLAVWIDYYKRKGASWPDVDFLSRNSNSAQLNFSDNDYELLYEEFIDFQTFEDISEFTFEKDDQEERKLFKVAKLVLLIPHLNAGIERVYSLVNKNTSERNRMDIDGTLSSILAVKIDRPEGSMIPLALL